MFCTSVSLPGKQVGLELGCFPPEAPVCFSLDCPPIQDLVALDVTSSSFHVSWSLNSTQNHTFHVQVYKGREMLRSTQTRSRTLAVPGLEAGVLYRVRTSYQGCGANVSATLLVKTGKGTCRKPCFLEWVLLSQSSGDSACHKSLPACRGWDVTAPAVCGPHWTECRVVLTWVPCLLTHRPCGNLLV